MDYRDGTNSNNKGDVKMTGIKGIIITVLLVSLVLGGGTFLIADFGGDTVDLLGESTVSDGETINSSMIEIAGEVEKIAEDPSTSTGVSGVVSAIKLFVKMPGYAANMLAETLAYFGIPGVVAVTLGAILMVIVIYEIILLLRGVAQ